MPSNTTSTYNIDEKLLGIENDYNLISVAVSWVHLLPPGGDSRG